jgi:hypothetical protein
VSTESVSCHALRFDHEDGLDIDEVYRRLLEHVVLLTWQWWLRSPQSPFQGPLRYSFEIDDEFVPCGYGEPVSSWAVGLQTQTLIGFERPLSPKLWRSIGTHIGNELPAETGSLRFADAIVNYKAGDIQRCILDLAICYSILENKMRRARGLPLKDNVDRLLEHTTIVGDKNRSVIKRLFEDRGQVAHGMEPRVIGASPIITVESYLQAMSDTLNAFIVQTTPEAERFSRMQLIRHLS